PVARSRLVRPRCPAVAPPFPYTTLFRSLEEYSHTEQGALYALSGSPLHESPLNLIPASLRPKFRETYGVDFNGELSPHSRARLRSEEHTSELQSREKLVCRLLPEKKKAR